MKQVLIRRGQVAVEEVPAPTVEPGTVLVRVVRSCISVGTELSGIRADAVPLWKRAIQDPSKVKKLVSSLSTQGVAATRSAVEGKLAAGSPTGYSAAGLVLAVGKDVTDLVVGDRVACAGAQYANHAEVIRVPRNLVVPIPDGVSFDDAATVTLGAIALQGVRRAQPTLGETFVVIGLGILGQLTIQLLKANGCRTIGADLDPARVDLAKSLGLDVGLADGEDAIAQVGRLTDGIGADGVIITAATPSDEVVSTAFRMCRRKGRVVLVGDVGLDLNRADFYAKELDFFISSSYGPGRYDRNYEERGLDYPVGYVRWTENRNMAEYLRLVADSRVKTQPLVSGTYSVQEADAAYASLANDVPRPMTLLLAYADGDPVVEHTVPNPFARPGRSGAIRVALVGAGGFAKGMHLPNIKALDEDFTLHAVVSHTGHNAVATAKQFGAAYSTTDVGEVLADKDVDLVLITTRHDLHASLAIAALERGKHVMVEKPLALTQEELDGIVSFFDAPSDVAKPVLLTGFNRRFSPYAARIADITAGRSNPMILTYRMNAGYLPLDHWVHGPEGGGRNRGEACHIYDLFTFLTGARVREVTARTIRPATAHYARDDNFVATMTFEDGSVATLAYTALGSTDHPKEQLEVFVDGKVIVLDDYRRLTVTGSKAPGLTTTTTDKGQRAELQALAKALHGDGAWPIPLWQQVQATEIALAVEAQITGS